MRVEEKITKVMLEFDRNSRGALFLNGKWGVGKTWFVQNKLHDILVKKNKRPIYISLFGIDSLDELKILIFSKFSSNTEKMNNKIIKKVVPIFSDYLSKSKYSKFSTFLNDFVQDSIIILDDIERIDSNFKVETLLGYISYMSTELNNNFLVIGNKEKLHDLYLKENSKSFYIHFEKVFRAEFELKTNFEEIFDKIVLSKSLQKEKNEILRIVSKSGHYNLRTLEKFVEFFEWYAEEHHIDSRLISVTYYYFILKAEGLLNDLIKITGNVDILEKINRMLYGDYSKNREETISEFKIYEKDYENIIDLVSFIYKTNLSDIHHILNFPLIRMVSNGVIDIIDFQEDFKVAKLDEYEKSVHSYVRMYFNSLNFSDYDEMKEMYEKLVTVELKATDFESASEFQSLLYDLIHISRMNECDFLVKNKENVFSVFQGIIDKAFDKFEDPFSPEFFYLSFSNDNLRHEAKKLYENKIDKKVKSIDFIKLDLNSFFKSKFFNKNLFDIFSLFWGGEAAKIFEKDFERFEDIYTFFLELSDRRICTETKIKYYEDFFNKIRNSSKELNSIEVYRLYNLQLNYLHALGHENIKFYTLGRGHNWFKDSLISQGVNKVDIL